ncbi:hypothetical protein ACSHWB_29005 [Lentzea sp. HUAS TT2]
MSGTAVTSAPTRFTARRPTMTISRFSVTTSTIWIAAAGFPD